MKKKNEFLKTEYQSISEYFTKVIDFRFIVFGFYITAIGLLFSEGVDKPKLVITFILTIFIWLLELRNRGLSGSLLERGMKIEKKLYGEEEAIEDNTFFHRMKFGSAGKLHAKKEDETRIFGIRITGGYLYSIDDYRVFALSHSFIFDLAYLIAIIGSIIGCLIIK